MSKQSATSLANLVPTRTAPRQVPVEQSSALEAVEAQPRKRQPSRVKTVMVAGHFDADVSYALHEICGRLTRQRGKRFTVQQALAEAMSDWFTKNGAEPPIGLRGE